MYRPKCGKPIKDGTTVTGLGTAEGVPGWIAVEYRAGAGIALTGWACTEFIE